MARDPMPTLDDWAERAAREAKGRSVSDLSWDTPEGIELKTVYTAQDIEESGFATTLPGFPPRCGFCPLLRAVKCRYIFSQHPPF